MHLLGLVLTLTFILYINGIPVEKERLEETNTKNIREAYYINKENQRDNKNLKFIKKTKNDIKTNAYNEKKNEIGIDNTKCVFEKNDYTHTSHK